MSLTKEKIKQFQTEYKDENFLRETIIGLAQLGTKIRKEESELLWDLENYRLNYCKYGGTAYIATKPVAAPEEPEEDEDNHHYDA